MAVLILGYALSKPGYLLKSSLLYKGVLLHCVVQHGNKHSFSPYRSISCTLSQ